MSLVIRHGVRITIIALALLFALCAVSTRADVPRPAGDSAWDGLDELVRLAGELDIELRRVHTLQLARVSANDALLIVGPHHTLPVAALSAFLREGGRIALLDDFGSGGRFLGAYQVERVEAPREGPALRDDPRLLLAYPSSEHPLAEGVNVLLTNEASALRHPELKPVFVFGRTREALVLAGAVGAGRLVAVGDASLVINQLMALPSHRRFARNLLEYLQRSTGRIWLVGPDASIIGDYGDEEKRGTAWLNAVLKRASHPDLPASVLTLIAFSLAAIFAVVAVSALPRKSPYLRGALFPDDTVYAGFAGRIALSLQPGSNLLWPLLDLKQEFEAELTRLLDLRAPFFDPRAALEAAGHEGLSLADQKALSTLLDRLSELGHMADDDASKHAVSAEELSALEREARRIATRLEGSNVSGRRST